MKRIFISKNISPEVRSHAYRLGYKITDAPMLKIVINYSDDTAQLIRNLAKYSKAVIFTSKNAVAATKSILSEQRPPEFWKIFTINGATQNELVDWYGHSDNIIHSVKSIRNLIPLFPKEIEEIHHISGDHFRPELESYALSNNITLHRYIVYESIQNSLKIDDEFSAYFFCSPRSVEAFIQKNILDHSATYVSIGPSTTEKLLENNIKNIIESEQPSIEEMLATYYQHDKK